MNRCLILLMVISLSARAQSGDHTGDRAGNHRAADSVQLVGFLDHFLTSFRTLNWEPFYACFSEEATAFFPPSSKFPYRASDKEQLGGIFRRVFEGARSRGSTLTIEPKEMKVQLMDGFAIVTFLLEDPGMLGRRTLVCVKTGDGWKILHLHASGIAQ